VRGHHHRRAGPFAAAICAVLLLTTRPFTAAPAELWRDVEVIRTAHGVPHIRAANLRAGGYALAWLQCEDYGTRTPMRLLEMRGLSARILGRAALDANFEGLRDRARAVATYHLLEPETRDMFDGFAAGVNRYIELHGEEFPEGMPADFSGYDVAALHIGNGPPAARVRRFVTALTGAPPASPEAEPAAEAGDDVGSNAWALAPGRTKSGHAILLRNPHLAWTAGYYEAHLTVPGVVDFYGDFRIGGPLIVVGGFNRDLGFATTNSNSGDLTEIYALDADPADSGRYLLDGASLPVTRAALSVDVLDGERISRETREAESVPFGRVVYRQPGRIFVARTAGDGEFRAGEQYLRMMRARSLAEWTDAMRLRALVTSNFTYADRAGNIFYLWNTSLPWLPHPAGGDHATPVHETRDFWTRYIPFDDLPHFLNPPGGYVTNENSSPHFANVRGKINTTNAYPNIEPPTLSLRSQHAIALIDNRKRFSLEDVVRLKHSYKMLLADRVKPDLIKAAAAARPAAGLAAAVELLRKWDNAAGPESRGAVLFELWWTKYSQGHPPAEQFAAVWSEADPVKTPRGLADPARAVAALASAAAEMLAQYGRLDVPWGEIHRVRRGGVDAPVGGCAGALGCFRVLNFARDPADGKLVANSADAWVLAVEFDDVPRAYSVLAYGESPRPESPWHADQAAMFARGELKKVAFAAGDVDAGTVARYRPGAPR
jgi:acyl-homoserine-lactone acylase